MLHTKWSTPTPLSVPSKVNSIESNSVVSPSLILEPALSGTIALRIVVSGAVVSCTVIVNDCGSDSTPLASVAYM